MKRLRLKYLVHFRDLTQREDEEIDGELDTLEDLIQLLEERYPGFSQLVLGKTGKLSPRNPIVLNRPGQDARSFLSVSEKLESGDFILVF